VTGHAPDGARVDPTDPEGGLFDKHVN
jgi:hypothetical protein